MGGGVVKSLALQGVKLLDVKKFVPSAHNKNP